VDYNKLYAGVAYKDSIHVFLALCNHFDLEIDQINIAAAFLNNVRKEEEIYLEPPEGSDLSLNNVL